MATATLSSKPERTRGTQPNHGLTGGGRRARSIVLITLVTMVGGFLFGYDTAVINGANQYLKAHFSLNPTQEGIAGASAILGCIPGAMCAGFLSDRFGRRKVLFACALLYAASAVLSAVPRTFAEFLAARFISGLGIGASSMVCPVYIAELAPADKRGRMGSLFQFGIVTGIFITLFINARIQGASVFLGLREGIQADEMVAALERAAVAKEPFPAGRYAAQWPARKHDHFLIPAGTVHCSGVNTMVLEVSATPYIFTFKLWDWGRLGLDGVPRPINLGHGRRVIQWDRTEDWARQNLVNRVEAIGAGPGWREERTGLHEYEFIETRRHWFTEAVPHDTRGTVNVLNLVEGREALVESPSGAFDPFPVHYAETFIVPADVGAYRIRPHPEAGPVRECGTIKASVRPTDPRGSRTGVQL